MTLACCRVFIYTLAPCFSLSSTNSSCTIRTSIACLHVPLHYSSYRIVIELHFHSVRKLSVLYRLEAGFQRFPCKKSASFGNHSAKDCYCIDLCTFTYFYSHCKSVYSIQLHSFLLISL